jgi:hypothetical protein
MSQTKDIRAAVIDDLTFDPDADASNITVEIRGVTNDIQIRDDAGPLSPYGEPMEQA